MRDWIYVNLFFLSIVLIGAAAIFVCFSMVKALQFSAENEPAAFILASIVALIGTGYATRWLHGVIQRRI